MIQDILPHKYDNSFKQPALAKDSFLLYIHRGTILLRGRDEQGKRIRNKEKNRITGRKSTPPPTPFLRRTLWSFLRRPSWKRRD